MSPERAEENIPGVHGIDLEAIDLRASYRQRFRALQEHLSAGRISQPEFFLLLGTRLHGHSLAEYARAAGLDYEVAKKKRQRLEARLKRLEEALR